MKTRALIEPDTRRLRLRQWRAQDREPFARMNADPRVMEHFPALLSRQQSDVLADRCESLIEANGWGLWAVQLRNDGRFIGFVGLNNPTAALRVGFEDLGLQEIVAFTAVGNRRSRAVMQRLGMSASGEFDHPNVPAGNPVRRHCLYRLSSMPA